nr:hypothetical protein [Tanacetum cinerariifolium]
MYFGPQTVGEDVISKFDMHVYTCVLTTDEVKNLVAEFSIPFDLHPCVPPSDLTMKRLPVDKIVATSMPESLKFPMARGVRVGKGMALADNERVVEYENERVLAAKQKAQASKDRAIGIHHFTSPLNIIIPNDANPMTGKGDVASESVGYEEDDADHGLENAEEGTEANSPPATRHSGSQRLHRSEADTHARSINLHHDARDEQGHHHASGSSGHVEHLGCAGKEAGLFNKLAAVEKENDDLLDKNREQKERIKWLKEELASKPSSLIEAESFVSELKGDLECLTVDLSQAEIFRHNYVGKLLPTTFRRLLSSNKYNKSLSDVFNQAIAAGWTEGVKVELTQEDAEVILATAADYNPGCKDTFMSAFDSLFTRSYPNVEKLIDSFHLPLEDLQNMWPEGTEPTLSGNAAEAPKCASLGHWNLNSSGASCALGNVRHLAIGTWTHLECLALREVCVTWPLVLGLIRNVLRSGKCALLGHWHLDSFGM